MVIRFGRPLLLRVSVFLLGDAPVQPVVGASSATGEEGTAGRARLRNRLACCFPWEMEGADATRKNAVLPRSTIRTIKKDVCSVFFVGRLCGELCGGVGVIDHRGQKYLGDRAV